MVLCVCQKRVNVVGMYALSPTVESGVKRTSSPPAMCIRTPWVSRLKALCKDVTGRVSTSSCRLHHPMLRTRAANRTGSCPWLDTRGISWSRALYLQCVHGLWSLVFGSTTRLRRAVPNRESCVRGRLGCGTYPATSAPRMGGLARNYCTTMSATH